MVLAAWSVSLEAADKKKPAAAEPTLVWPLPPDPPRIRFVTAYRSVDDFKQKSGSRWKSLLLGPETDKRVTQLMKPYGVAVAKDGRVFVTDTVARRVFVFDPVAKSVKFVGENGTGKVVKPIGVAVDDAATMRALIARGVRGAILSRGSGWSVTRMSSTGNSEYMSTRVLTRTHVLRISEPPLPPPLSPIEHTFYCADPPSLSL